MISAAKKYFDAAGANLERQGNANLNYNTRDLRVVTLFVLRGRVDFGTLLHTCVNVRVFELRKS